jgi:hypothetical protein
MNKRSRRVGTRKPTLECDKLPWPGLRARDHLTRVVTRIVKEMREDRELEERKKKKVGLNRGVSAESVGHPS